MATQISRQLKVGTIIDKALAVVELNAKPVLVFVAVFTAVNIAITYMSLSLTAITEQAGVGLAKFAVAITAAYLLLDTMVRRTGLRTRTSADVFFPFIGLSILYILGVYAGFIALVLPGLVVMARWSIAQPLLVARGEGVTKSLGESWERTRGNEFPILVAAFALILPLIAILIACSALFEKENLIGIVVTQIATSATSIV